MVRSMLKIMLPKERWAYLGFIALTAISGFVELTSVISIVPYISYLSGNEVKPTNGIYEWFWNLGQFSDKGTFSVSLGLFTIIAIGLSSIYLAAQNWLTFKFIFKMGGSLINRLYRLYVFQPYMFFLNRNSNELIRNIFVEMNRVIQGIYLPLNIIISRGFVVLILLGLLVYTDPVLALLSALVLGLGYLFVFLIVKKRLERTSKEAIASRQEAFSFAVESFMTIKDLKLYQQEGKFSERFRNLFDKSLRPETNQAIISVIPRFLIEFLTFGGIVLILLYLMGSAKDFASIIPVISVYAFSTYKMVPYLQQIYQSAVNIQFSRPSLDVLIRESSLPIKAKVLEKPSLNKTEGERDSGDIVLRDVSFQYPGMEKKVLDQINLEIKKNQVIGIIGKTGSGKSTLVDLILGLLQPTNGEIILDRSLIGYVPQQIILWDQSITRNIAFTIAGEQVNQELLEESVKTANLYNFIKNDLPQQWETKVGDRGVRLSGGQRQRIGLARALYRNPSILILDEATSALDNETEALVMDALNALGGKKTIIMIAHRLSTLDRCDAVYEVTGGKLEKVR